MVDNFIMWGPGASATNSLIKKTFNPNTEIKMAPAGTGYSLNQCGATEEPFQNDQWRTGRVSPGTKNDCSGTNPRIGDSFLSCPATTDECIKKSDDVPSKLLDAYNNGNEN